MRSADAITDDRGETLLELVIAILIAGVCVIAVGSGIALSIKISTIHRQQAIAGQYLHDDAELLRSVTYQPCSSAPNYATGLPAPTTDGPWTLSQSAIKYWDGTTFGSACPAVDLGLAQVTLRLRTANGLVDETLDVIVRVPL